MECYICGTAKSGQCQDCSGDYCTKHGEGPYCVVCALKHDDVVSLGKAISTNLFYELDWWEKSKLIQLRKVPPDLLVPFERQYLAELERLEAEVKQKNTRVEEVLNKRLLPMFYDSDHTVRFKVVYALRFHTHPQIIKTLAETLRCDKNQWVREAAFKALSQNKGDIRPAKDIILECYLSGKIISQSHAYQLLVGLGYDRDWLWSERRKREGEIAEAESQGWQDPRPQLKGGEDINLNDPIWFMRQYV